MNPELHVEGAAELEQAVRALGDERIHARTLGSGLRAAAKVVAKHAKITVPVSTAEKEEGHRHLRDTIRAVARPWHILVLKGSTPTAQKVNNAAAEVKVGGPGARHAHLVELGTRHSAANPFLAQAISTTAGQQQHALVQASARAFTRAVQEIAATPRGGKLSAATRRLIR